MPNSLLAQAPENTGGGLMGIVNKLPKDETGINQLVDELSRLNELVEAKN